MQILPIDIVSLVGTILGISIVLVPVIGVTARFALSPTVEALSKLFDSRSRDESLHILERRLELQEQEINMLTQAVRNLAEGQEFDRALKAPDGSDSGTPRSRGSLATGPSEVEGSQDAPGTAGSAAPGGSAAADVV